MDALTLGTRLCTATLAMILLVSTAFAAEDPQVEQLRTDVRTLERDVRALTQRVDQLQQALNATPATPAVKRLSTVADPDPGFWMPPEKWDRIRTGMSAQDVILLLGAPVSMRPGGRPGMQTLFYTLPIGDGGFLTGAVKMQDNKVEAVEKPVLKEAGKTTTAPTPER